MATVRRRTWKSGGEMKTAWIADFFDQEGKRHIKTCKTKKEADGFLVQARHEIARGLYTPENASITVAEAAKLWIEKGELEKLERSTLRQYSNHVKLHINPLIGGVKLARLPTPAIEAFRDELLKKRSRAMARKVLASLKSILSEAQRRGLVARNAAQPVKVEIRKRDHGKLAAGRDIPSKKEVQTMLAMADGRWRPLLITAIFTGMRSSELRGLTWVDVDFEQKVIHVRQRADHWGEIGAPKSAAGDRKIPMSPMVANALRNGGWHARGPWQGRRGPRAAYGSSSRTATATSRITRTSRTGVFTRSRSRPGLSTRRGRRNTACMRSGTSSRPGRSSAVSHPSAFKRYSDIARSR